RLAALIQGEQRQADGDDEEDGRAGQQDAQPVSRTLLQHELAGLALLLRGLLLALLLQAARYILPLLRRQRQRARRFALRRQFRELRKPRPARQEAPVLAGPLP